MDNLLEIFSTRELSLMIWVILLIVVSQFSKGIRTSTFALLRAFFQASILGTLVLSFAYSAGIVFLLYKIEAWDETLLKDSIFWFIGSAFVILFNITKAGKEKDFFKNIAIDNVKLVLIFEFLVNFHAFSLITEIILLPILLFLGLLSAYAGLKDEHKGVKKFMDGILSAIAVIFLVYSMIDIIQNPSSINFQTGKTLFLPIVLTICFLPWAYLIALYMNYEVFFVRLGMYLKKKEILVYAKRRLLLKCHFSLRRLNKVSPLINELYDRSTAEDIRRIID
jgi:hypothetical protein